MHRGAYLDVQPETFVVWMVLIVQRLTNAFSAQVIAIRLASALADKLCMRKNSKVFGRHKAFLCRSLTDVVRVYQACEVQKRPRLDLVLSLLTSIVLSSQVNQAILVYNYCTAAREQTSKQLLLYQYYRYLVHEVYLFTHDFSQT